MFGTGIFLFSSIAQGGFKKGRMERENTTFRNPLLLLFSSLFSLIFVSLDLDSGIVIREEDLLCFGSSYFPQKERLSQRKNDSTALVPTHLPTHTSNRSSAP